MADSVADLWAYEPPISLWSLVENHVHPHEREEVRNMLGASLVEQSLELHDEVSHSYLHWFPVVMISVRPITQPQQTEFFVRKSLTAILKS